MRTLSVMMSMTSI